MSVTNGRSRPKLFTSFGQTGAKPMTAGAMALMNTHETSELLGRVDERTQAMTAAVKIIDIKLDKHDERLGRVEAAVESLAPVKNVVYKAIGTILVIVLIAVMALVITRQYTVKDMMQSAPAAK